MSSVDEAAWLMYARLRVAQGGGMSAVDEAEWLMYLALGELLELQPEQYDELHDEGCEQDPKQEPSEHAPCRCCAAVGAALAAQRAYRARASSASDPCD